MGSQRVGHNWETELYWEGKTNAIQTGCIIKICIRNLLSSIVDWSVYLGESYFGFCYFYLLSTNYTAFAMLPERTYKNKRQATWESGRASINWACPGWPGRQHLHQPGQWMQALVSHGCWAHGTGSGRLSLDADGLTAAFTHTFRKLICIFSQRNKNGVSLLRGYEVKLPSRKWKGTVSVSWKRDAGKTSSLETQSADWNPCYNV